jgi:hypothetical protein
VGGHTHEPMLEISGFFMDDTKKQKLIWVRTLLRDNAPIIYSKFCALKRYKDNAKNYGEFVAEPAKDDFIEGLEKDKKLFNIKEEVKSEEWVKL